jgi:hypothetical protein
MKRFCCITLICTLLITISCSSQSSNSNKSADSVPLVNDQKIPESKGVVYPPLSRIGLVPAPGVWVVDGPSEFDLMNAGNYGWGVPITLRMANPITWKSIKDGDIKSASANPYSDNSPRVDSIKRPDGALLLYSEMTQGTNEEGFFEQVMGEINGVAFQISGTLQSKSAPLSKAQLKSCLTSVSVRPQIDEATFKKETPILPSDMAGFSFFTVHNNMMCFRDLAWPKESAEILDDHVRSLNISSGTEAEETVPPFSTFKLTKEGIENHISIFEAGSMKVHRHQKNGTKTWHIFETTGSISHLPERGKVFYALYICYEKGKPSLTISVQTPEADREQLMPRITRFRESLSFVRIKRTHED